MGEAPASILVVEDDRATRRSVSLAFELERYAVRSVSNGADALSLQQDAPADLVVLDLGLPHIDGLSVCRMLRARRDEVPILVLTARDGVGDRVLGLDAGADDYLAKPFALEELLARVRALLRRSVETEREALAIGTIRVDEATRRAYVGEGELELSKTEFDLLVLLVRNAGFVLSRERIYEEIWGYDFGAESNNLAVYIGYLRRKLDDAAFMLRTVRGVGYVLRP